MFVELHAEILEDKTEKYSMTLSFGKDDSLFFPYTNGEYNIAIIPHKMDSRFDQLLVKEQYELIKQALGDIDGKLTLYIQLRPQKAYMDAPLQIGGIEQWVTRLKDPAQRARAA